MAMFLSVTIERVHTLLIAESEIRARVGRFNFWSPAAMKFLGSHTR